MNLKPDGTGDMEPASLKELDLVLGSFHSALRRKEDQTERYLAALNHPNVHILGHPRGRIYNFRIGLTADWSRVFDAAASLNKALKSMASPIGKISTSSWSNWRVLRVCEFLWEQTLIVPSN
jgi:histidinol phosphatase-like PHP family hydrolase